MYFFRSANSFLAIGALAFSTSTLSVSASETEENSFHKGEPDLSLRLTFLPTEIPGFRLDGVGQNDNSGRSVSGAGDVNGDGFADVIVGARSANVDPLFAGEAYVIFGNPDGGIIDLGSIGNSGFRIDGNIQGESLGQSVSGAGDFNGDGLDDLIIGASNSSVTGRAVLVFGKTDSNLVDLETPGSNAIIFSGFENIAQTGYSVSGAGDVNGDGFDDVLIATRRGNPTGNPEDDDRGIVHVVFGSSNPASITLDNLGSGGFQINGANSDDDTGMGLSGAGDVNGDGLCDIIIGSPLSASQGAASGEAYVVFGKTDTATIELGNLGTSGFIIQSPGGSDLTGNSVSGAGDINGDGLADIIVSAHGGDQNGSSSGEVFAIFGKPDSTPVDLANPGTMGFRIDGMAQGDQAGYSVSGAGDVNRDGLMDLIIGARFADPDGRVNAGETYVVFGKTDTGTVDLRSQGSLSFEIEGDLAGDNSGGSVSAAGDVNGDGVADLLIGAALADGDMPYSGRSYVVFSPLEQSIFAAEYKAIAKSGDAPVLAVGTTGDGENPSSPASRCWIDFDDGSGPGLNGSSLQTVTIHDGLLVNNLDGALPLNWIIETDRTNWTSAEITLRYTESELEGFPENGLQVFQAPIGNGPWTAVSSVVQDTVLNQISFDTSTTGFFAIATGLPSPSVTLSTDAGTFVNNSIQVTATFDSTVTGFTIDDLETNNATVDNFAATANPLVYEFDLIAENENLFSVTVPVNAAQGTNGQGNTVSNELARLFDETRPTATLSTSAPDPTNMPFTVSVILNENVTDITLDDFQVTNGSASNLIENSAGSYDVTITPASNGTVGIQLMENAGFDAAGNGNTLSNELEIFNDSTGPQITLTSSSPELTSQTVLVQATFSEIPFDVQPSDVTATNGTVPLFQQTGTPTIYVYRLDAVAGGEVTTFMDAGVVTDELGNPSTASNTLQFTFDTTGPTPTLSSSPGTLSNTNQITVSFDEEIIGFDLTDVTITNGTASSFQTNTPGIEFQFIVEPENTNDIIISISENQLTDIIGNPNAESNELQIGTADPVDLWIID